MKFPRIQPNRAVTVVELMMTAAAASFVLAALASGAMAARRTLTYAEEYPLAKMHVSDYLTLDIRRSLTVTPTLTGTKLTLPLVLKQFNYYESDGRTLRAPQRTQLTTADLDAKKNARAQSNKKKVKAIESKWTVHYGPYNTFTTVRYDQQGDAILRTEGTQSPVVIARGVKEIVFNADDLLQQKATFTVSFNPARFNHLAAPSGSMLITSSCYLRQEYYNE